ncbi:pyrroloquinoline quinone biosynthesis peptide chaperone PqqD [Phaeobacter gallaeciensis]|uniref:Coenzyme PQQ biosynthesis protein PqqD n=1 Tax=Phaeobacter gallaeciensis TaxID=60890 RepID=A0AAD0EF34_9RHOB|nr:pyrroloquinoline quinone biosynthesis peptide chaperone PqqD [Phaeobacter gallaeciensis]AHD11603.1 coenzyme PQQ biosynthesis protein PqqD [Phaeobacter gallaeciensis DSM 26640]ATE94867.1 coenzyme PQQ biosynthesis protein PqqD [Phaeobacter gallaeciensis]ATE99138.1 coenzyme PQQ biosynthesis protein PqqD [Phaeobacter gallaeciensis]ATF03531.1 coenzyme PQQ biosynthesis protein PqqD [Phaeobacter gallaeciensis]ATF07911.1 coenzyme PQQ biosynthesis protein PqqD [Phaeobacter gallaeciensis]
MQPQNVPYLPRGVRTQFDKLRQVEVLLGPERVLILDQVGVAVLERLDGVASLRGISQALSDVYDAPLDVIEPDVIAFVQDLREKGMVHVQPH